MDISGFISDLLYENDCVIIPGFGGFICSYQPAQIIEEMNAISPPSKAMSFNSALQTNDGLLTNHIAKTGSITFAEANEIISAWVTSAKILLRDDEYIELKNIGKLSPQPDGALDFQPSGSVNYLKSSYGLKTISAVPVVHKKEVSQKEAGRETGRKYIISARNLRLAAMIVLLALISFLAGLMWTGYNIKALYLNEAGVSSLILHTFSREAPVVQPLPVENTMSIPVPADSTKHSGSATTDSVTAAMPMTSGISASEQPGYDQKPQHGVYYVIVGVFREEKNVESARTRVLLRLPVNRLLLERVGGLTRVGYAVGSNFADAKTQLLSARDGNPDFWLLKN